MTAIANSPAYPTAGQTVTFSLTGAAGNAAEYELTSVPDESSVATGMLLDGRGDPIATFTPDVAGAYGVKAYDYRECTAPPQYAGDPTGDYGHRALRGTCTGTLYVGRALDLPIVTELGHGATLRITVNNATVRAAELVNVTSDVARVAAIDSTVLAGLATFAGTAVTSLGEQLTSGVTELRTKYEAHRVRLTDACHLATGDTTNAMVATAPDSETRAIVVLNELYDRIAAHLAKSTWHNADDGKNTPVIAKAKTLAEATVLLADLKWRVYNRHRTQTASPNPHTAADNVNTLATQTLLSAFIMVLLDAIVAASPATPAGENAGAVAAAHRYGFGEV